MLKNIKLEFDYFANTSMVVEPLTLINSQYINWQTFTLNSEGLVFPLKLKFWTLPIE